MTTLPSLAKKGLDTLMVWRFEQFHRREATRRLKALENQHGKTDPSLIRQCHDYATDVLGWKGYAPWLVTYTAAAGTFREGWIPDNYFGRIVLPHINGNFGYALGSRAGLKHLFRTEAFPDIGAIANGLLYDQQGKVMDEQAFEHQLFNGRDRVIFKTDTSYKGMGTHVITRGDFDLPVLRKAGNGVMQYYIDQHDFFAQYIPTSCATLRLSTLIDNEGQCAVRGAYIKFGRIGETYANAESHVRVMVDSKTGTLGAKGYFDEWDDMDGHPDCDKPTAEQTIPHFADCVAMVTGLHQRFPYARWLGWDVVVDSNGEVKIMECNGGHSEVKSTEALQGPVFTDMGWETLWRDA